MGTELKLSELYLALQGEQCFYTRTSSHRGYNLKNVSGNCPSFPITLATQMQQIVDFSSTVKAIETWKVEKWKEEEKKTEDWRKKQLEKKAEQFKKEQSKEDQLKKEQLEKEEEEKKAEQPKEELTDAMFCLDSVKKTILESVIDDYNIYQTMADQMRREDALHKRTDSIIDLCAFAKKWHHRLNYLLDLLLQSDKLCGLQMMNMLFEKWTFQCCIRDWRYRMLEKALHAGSAAMHQLLIDWLLDAKLPPALTRWFIRPKIAGTIAARLISNNDADENDPNVSSRQRRSFSNSVLFAGGQLNASSNNNNELNLNASMTSMDSSNNVKNEPLIFGSMELMRTIGIGGIAFAPPSTTATMTPPSKYNNNNSSQALLFSPAVGGGGGDVVVNVNSSSSIVPPQLFLDVLLDNDVLPIPFYGCPELLNMVMDTGRKVHFLKVLRSARSYEHQMALRKELCDKLPPNVWYTPSNAGRMAIALQQMRALVSADMHQELLDGQRLMDHLCLVHGYFFMLRGDFASALEHVFFIKTAKTTGKKRGSTPFSLRKNVKNSAKIAEKCVNDALALCTPPANVADLMHFLYAERPPPKQMKGKMLSEHFMLTYALRESRRHEIYEFKAVAQFFTSKAMRAYKRVFSFVSNLQLQRAQLEHTGQNLLRIVRLRQLLNTPRMEFRSFVIAILVGMQSVRMFLNCLASYVFEVLLLESISIFDKVRTDCEKDPHVLLANLYPLLNGVLYALFYNSTAFNFHESVQQCIGIASDFVGAVNNFCAFMEHSEFDVLLRGTAENDENNKDAAAAIDGQRHALSHFDFFHTILECVNAFQVGSFCSVGAQIGYAMPFSSSVTTPLNN